MMNEQEPLSRREIEARILAKAWSDESFMAELRADPRAAIEKEFDRKLPEAMRIEVHFETAENRTYHVVIPEAPEGELADEELAAAAGGVGGGEVPCWCNRMGHAPGT